MALVVESGLFKIVLRQQICHLLLNCTNFGYGTVLTAACARQGCSASGWFGFFILGYFFNNCIT
jgi:hypothetical protein